MIRHHNGAWAGPECPWCGDEMTHTGKVTTDDGLQTVWECRQGHWLHQPTEEECCS